jgi:hypothetical protein
MNGARGMKDHITKIHKAEMKDNYIEATLSNPESVITSFINKTNQKKLGESWQPNLKSYCCKVCNESYSSHQQLRVPTLARGHLRARHMRADISAPTVARKYNLNILAYHLRNYWSEYQ